MTSPKLRKILYVEDDLDIRLVTEIALVGVGNFVVAVCASGREAVAEAPGFAPDLLLLDVMMPEMDGPATLRALRSLPVTADTPAVFMTAKGQTHEVARYKALGAVDVIVKPFDPMALPQMLHAIWNRAHDRR